MPNTLKPYSEGLMLDTVICLHVNKTGIQETLQMHALSMKCANENGWIKSGGKASLCRDADTIVPQTSQPTAC